MENFLGQVNVAVPVVGVSVILGNDIARKRVFSLPEVVSKPVTFNSQAGDQHSVFPVCVDACPSK